MNQLTADHFVGLLPWFLLLVLSIVLYFWNSKRPGQSIGGKQNVQPVTSGEKNPSGKEHSEEAYYSIEPLSDFDLEKTEPLQLRPFKPKYHMTMALENTTLSDLVAMDKTYLERLDIRRQIIQDQRSEVIACELQAVPAVMELYTWAIGTYLPRRFPSIYGIVHSTTSEETTSTYLKNHATNTLIPLQVSSPDLALQILGENIDTEFLLLQKQDSPNFQTPEPYRLTAFVNCFPAGFSTLSKLGLSLAAIHAPVPHYAEKLEKSMDRYFSALPVGKIVKRVNWSISTTGDLFCLAGAHMSESELETPRERERQEESVDLDKTVVRCERQTLHRLPRTGALVFGFKTYIYPIQQIRDEGNGHVLAEAIDGLGRGTVPKITVYKRQVVWGEKVKAFLRGEINA
ncbi:hypothetical protein COCVIDRAFT_27947 [Bipolaris victoriae FI3]|uniref:Uncharacterized protein n=1 Tax=Bipolaris victoriae (strain FI3) TaxID=930091 RepID=W7E4U9_BIPV3|nr:hypothetical protein COCVIDRAFT_27947 [Bipolaris victoriae FI3]